MILGVYAIQDVKVGFLQPFTDQSDAAAVRGFSYSMSNSDGIMGFSPADFQLYRIGDYDTATGLLTSLTPMLFLANGASVVSAAPEADHG